MISSEENRKMSARSPKDLKQMVAASQGDADDMRTNLAKLRALSDDDKTENALLRGRIEEQSQLIMILKQRVDESTVKMRTMERINKELEDFRNSAAEEFEQQARKCSMLDARFYDLAQNHEEMIKIKDDYKMRNKELMLENARLLDDNKRLFSKAIEERDERIVELERRMRQTREQHLGLDTRHKELQEVLRTTEEKYKTETTELRSKLADTEERLKGAMAKLKHETESRTSLDADSQKRIQVLTKEKNELLELTMSRGKLIQEKQVENKKLQQQVEDIEKAMRNQAKKFERDAASVSVNAQVQRLKSELDESEDRYDDAIKEFDAYKKHTNALIQKERELNERLRHLMG